MKFFLSLVLITASAFASAESIMTCQTRKHAGSINITTEQQGNVAYLYTTGRIVCPASVDYIIPQKANFKCVGLWDFKQEKLSVDFKHDGEKYVATLQASSAYGNKKLQLECDL